MKQSKPHNLLVRPPLHPLHNREFVAAVPRFAALLGHPFQARRTHLYYCTVIEDEEQQRLYELRVEVHWDRTYECPNAVLDLVRLCDNDNSTMPRNCSATETWTWAQDRSGVNDNGSGHVVYQCEHPEHGRPVCAVHPCGLQQLLNEQLAVIKESSKEKRGFVALLVFWGAFTTLLRLDASLPNLRDMLPEQRDAVVNLIRIDEDEQNERR